MTRKEQTMDAAMFFAKKNKNNPNPYLDFVEAVEWADRTMIEKLRNKLQDDLCLYVEDIDRFCKELMEE